VQAHHLAASDVNGYTDAFFTVEWEGMVQKTKVAFKSLDPIFKEKLYFPVLLFTWSDVELEKKEQVGPRLPPHLPPSPNPPGMPPP
jgi:Ca2+-dependent lipid-binding protein